MAIIDILSILPTFIIINNALRALRAIRLIKALRVLKVVKSFRYSKNITIIANVLKKQRKSLCAVCFLAISYILISALLIFNVEPETFPTFFDAVYWATVSLTTVGYGDIYTVSTAGKVITMISAVLGIAIVALPAGIITAGYMNEIQSDENAEEKKQPKTED
jgi:voltage-gated potassium channel